MATTITSNGSKWYGESSDTIEVLLGVLSRHPLDRSFERIGGFINKCPHSEMVRFFGNFHTVSHVFNINSDDPEVVSRLREAINANTQRADYISQPNPMKKKATVQRH